MNKADVKTLHHLIVQSAECYGEKTYMKEVIKREVAETSFAKLLDNSRRICTFENNFKNGEKFHAAVIGGTSSAYLTAYLQVLTAFQKFLSMLKKELSVLRYSRILNTVQKCLLNMFRNFAESILTRLTKLYQAQRLFTEYAFMIQVLIRLLPIKSKESSPHRASL